MFTFAAAILAASIGVANAQQRDVISIVGSSTVYPFATVVAERFGKASSFKTPKIESTGTGGGFKLFCGGVGIQHPDIANASRAIKADEFETCKQNGVTEVVEVKIGYDGIVVANAKKAQPMKLTRKDLFLALAKEVPDPSGAEKTVPNPYKTWKDVNPALPDAKIEVLGPPPTSGTRDAFLELAMEPGAKKFEWLAKLARSPTRRSSGPSPTPSAKTAPMSMPARTTTSSFRSSGPIPDALGIFGFSYLDQNTDKIQGASVDGAQPTFELIADGKYPLSRPLFIYVKKAHVGRHPGHQGIPGGVHQRKGLGQGRLPERKRPHSPAGCRTQADGE